MSRTKSTFGNVYLKHGSDFFAFGGTFTLEKGRFLVLADHSVFSNSLVLPQDNRRLPVDDNANTKFIDKCMDWLQGSVRETHKTRCLFVEDGEIKTDFDLPMPEDNLSLLDFFINAMIVMERHGDTIAAQMEERDFFNETFFRLFTLREIVRFGMIVLSVVLLVVSFVYSVRRRVTPDPARTLITPELAAMIPRGTVLQQRFDGQLASENLYEAARDMVRDCLGGLDAEPDAAGRPPALEIAVKHPNAFELGQKIMRLWHVGFGPQPLKVDPREWRGMLEDLEKILEEADHSSWKFRPMNKG